MTTIFGENVLAEAKKHESLGIDPNQLSNILWKKDAEGKNYGIGIILDGQGKPLGTSSTLLNYVRKELDGSLDGDYKNSNALTEKIKLAVLKWQRIPVELAPQFKLLLPSDAGTGSVQTAMQIALLLEAGISTLAVEELGWPAYKTMAKVERIGFKEFPQEQVLQEKNTLTIYQAGPMNTTGFVCGHAAIKARAEAAAKAKSFVILDRAYSGFEYARLTLSTSYDEIMKKSFELQLKPYIDAKAPFILALSPTKAFVTFSLRPCGFLLVYTPDVSYEKNLGTILNTVIRARGASFEHAITRAFVKAFIESREQLEMEHKTALLRLAKSELKWRSLSKGTPLEAQFSDHYAGLFRNPHAKPDAALNIYNAHLYPVFSTGRCRLNATGIPDDDTLAREHVEVFCKYCF